MFNITEFAMSLRVVNKRPCVSAYYHLNGGYITLADLNLSQSLNIDSLISALPNEPETIKRLGKIITPIMKVIKEKRKAKPAKYSGKSSSNTTASNTSFAESEAHQCDFRVYYQPNDFIVKTLP